jgi:hypothetical protein
VNAFQIVGVGITGAFAVLTVAAAWRRQVGRASAVFWTLVWSAAGTAIAYPNSTMIVARTLGIARGADLVFYCAILGMLVGFFLVYVRLRRMERNISLLVRRMALDEAPDTKRGEPSRSVHERG